MSMHRTEIRFVVTYSTKLNEMEYVPYCTLPSLYLFIKKRKESHVLPLSCSRKGTRHGAQSIFASSYTVTGHCYKWSKPAWDYEETNQ